MGLWEKMKFAVVFVVVVDGGGEIEVAAVEIVVSWLCLPCHPLWSNGPYQKRVFDERMRQIQGRGS